MNFQLFESSIDTKNLKKFFYDNLSFSKSIELCKGIWTSTLIFSNFFLTSMVFMEL